MLGLPVPNWSDQTTMKSVMRKRETGQLPAQGFQWPLRQFRFRPTPIPFVSGVFGPLESSLFCEVDMSLNPKRQMIRVFQSGTCRVLILVVCACTTASFAQVTPTSQSQGAPLTITLQDALQRARLNDPQYRLAITDLGVAREDRVQARAGLLPDLNYNNSFVYTQGTGPLPANCAPNTTA